MVVTYVVWIENKLIRNWKYTNIKENERDKERKKRIQEMREKMSEQRGKGTENTRGKQ